MSTPTGPYTVRRQANGKPGAVVLQGTRQILATTTVAETQQLIAGLQATDVALPRNLTPLVIAGRPR